MVTTFIVFSILKIPYSALIGVLTAVLAFLPYVGAFFACATGMLLVLLAQEICPHQEQPLENGPVLYHLVEMLHVNCLPEDQLYLPQTFVLIV